MTKKTMPAILPALLIFLLAGGGGPKLPDEPWREYKIVDLEERGENALKINAVEEVVGYSSRFRSGELNGEPMYVLERIERTKQGDRHEWTFYLKPGNLSLVQLEKRTVSRTGKEVGSLYKNFIDPMFGFGEPLCHVYTITMAMKAMDLKEGSTHDIQLLLGEDSYPWHMWVVVEGSETLEVPAGSFEVYRVRLDPDYKSIMGKWSWASSIVKPLVPDYYFFMEKKAPHLMVKFRGTMGPVGGSPPQEHLLVDVGDRPEEK